MRSVKWHWIPSELNPWSETNDRKKSVQRSTHTHTHVIRFECTFLVKMSSYIPLRNTLSKSFVCMQLIHLFSFLLLLFIWLLISSLRREIKRPPLSLSVALFFFRSIFFLTQDNLHMRTTRLTKSWSAQDNITYYSIGIVWTWM